MKHFQCNMNIFRDRSLKYREGRGGEKVGGSLEFISVKGGLQFSSEKGAAHKLHQSSHDRHF